MADRAYLSVLPLEGQQPLTEKEAQSLINVLGVTVMAEFSATGLLLGFPWDRFPDRSLARGNLEIALTMQVGEDWNSRFRVVDS